MFHVFLILVALTFCTSIPIHRWWVLPALVRKTLLLTWRLISPLSCSHPSLPLRYPSPLLSSPLLYSVSTAWTPAALEEGSAESNFCRGDSGGKARRRFPAKRAACTSVLGSCNRAQCTLPVWVPVCPHEKRSAAVRNTATGGLVVEEEK